MWKIKNTWKVVALALTPIVAFYPVAVFAQASSTNYRLEEAYFGTGGELDASSSNYRARQSVGSLGVGDVSSSSYDAILGGVTPETPFLEFVVTESTVDLGVLSDVTTAYGSPTGGACSCSFYVRSYLDSQYVVINASAQPPTNESGAFLDPKTSQGAASGDQNTEEFGFNLVANTAPGTFGANPVNVPDDTFADGEPAPGYETTNQYKFLAGDIIAQSPATAGNPAVGQTNYTISYIAKKKPLTEAGAYRLNHDLVVIATF